MKKTVEREGVNLSMERFDFTPGEEVTFFWKLTSDPTRLSAAKAIAVENEETGVWFDFGDEEDESFVNFADMHLFIRDNSNIVEGTEALSVNVITKAIDDNISPSELKKLIASLAI